MLEFLGENYYVDFDMLENHVNIPKIENEEEGTQKKKILLMWKINIYNILV